jgi:hypothetical protein
MNAWTLLFIFLLSPTLVKAQYEFKPILDPSVICNKSVRPKQHILNPLNDESFEKYDIYYIVEEMPVPKMTVDNIEELLQNVIRMNHQEKSKNFTMHFQCIINCRGEAGDYQVIYCPAESVNTGNQVLKVLRESVHNWSPGMLRDTGVDVLVRITVTAIDGKYKVKAPVF